MKVLVTGGAGFIGSHVVDKLIAAGHEPRIFDLVASPYHDAGSVETVVGDLTDPAAAVAAIAGCDAVIHLAAMADVNEVLADPVRTERVNAHGTFTLLEAAREPASSASSTRAPSGCTATLPPRSRTTRTPRSSCRRTSTRRPSSPVRCTAATYDDPLRALDARSCASGSPTGRAPARPRSCPPSSAAARAGEALTISGDG